MALDESTSMAWIGSLLEGSSVIVSCVVEVGLSGIRGGGGTGGAGFLGSDNWASRLAVDRMPILGGCSGGSGSSAMVRGRVFTV